MTYIGSAAQSGRGSTLGIGATPTLIGEIKTSSLGGSQWGTADVTNFESGISQEFITTIRNEGEFSLAGNRVSGDAGQVAVETAYGTGAVSAFTLTLPKTTTQTTSGDKYTFNAIVLSRDFDVDVTKEISWNVKLKVSGAITLVPGS